MTSPASSVNLYSLNDQPVEVDMGMLGKLTIRPKPEGAPWGVTIIEERTTLLDKGDDEHPRLVTPAKDIAMDVINRYPGEGLFLADRDDAPSTSEVAQAAQEF